MYTKNLKKKKNEKNDNFFTGEYKPIYKHTSFFLEILTFCLLLSKLVHW